MPQSLRIATRASQLALWQANHIARLLRESLADITVELVQVSTMGDRVQTDPLRQFGGLGVFTREVQAALLDGRADLAVHSLKDLPTEPTPGLILAATPPREEMFDALVFPQGFTGDATFAGLPEGARIGTGSPRRQSQLKYVRPDLQLLEIRGNVDTRLKKLDAGEYDAIVLACAGLKRLGWQDRISLRLEPPLMYPAVGQGIIGIECRADAEDVQAALRSITHVETWGAALAERSLLATLRAGCHAPVGVRSTLIDDQLQLEGVILDPAGTERLSASATGIPEDAVQLGQLVAQLLIGQGAERMINA